jgi:hypothetical protein
MKISRSLSTRLPARWEAMVQGSAIVCFRLMSFGDADALEGDGLLIGRDGRARLPEDLPAQLKIRADKKDVLSDPDPTVKMFLLPQCVFGGLACVNARRVKEGNGRVSRSDEHRNLGTSKDHALRSMIHQPLDDLAILGAG